MSLLGTLVVRIAAEMARYKTDLNEAAQVTVDAAGKIDQSTKKVSESARKGFGEVGAAAQQSAQQQVDASRKAVDASARQVSAMDDLKSAAKSLGLTYAAYKVVDQIREMTMLNARYQELGVVMGVVGKNAGYNAHEMARYAAETQRMGISMMESRNTVIQLAQAEIDLANASKLARVAQDAAVIGNTNSSNALATMIHGIKSAQTDVLRSIGINVNFEQSYKDLAGTLGVTTAALSEKQKMQARENAVMDEGAKLAGAYEASMDTAGKQVRSMTRYVEDLKVMGGAAFNETLTVAVMAFVDQLKDANTEVKGLASNGALREWGNDVADTFAFVVDAGLSVISVTKMIGATVGWLAARAANGNSAGTTKEQLQASGKAIDDAYLEDLERLRNGTSVMRDALEKRRSAHAQTAAGIASTEKQYLAAQLVVQKAYAGQSLDVQQKAQLALRNGYFAADPKAPGARPTSPDNTAGKAAAKAYEQATKAANDYIQTLKQETQEVGLNADQVKMLGAARAAAKAPLAAQRVEIMAGALALSIATKKENEATEATKAHAKADLAAAEAHGKYVDSLVSGLDKLQQEVAAQKEHNDRLGLGKEAIAALDAAKLESQAVTLDLLAVKTLDKNLYKAQAAELRKLAVLKGQGAAKEVAIDEAKDAAAEWKKTAESIESSLTDALMRGFESGKEFGKNLRDTLVNMFKTLILRPIISAVMNPIAQGITGMMGLSGAAQAGTSLAGSAGGAYAAGSISSFMAPVTAAMSTFGTAALASTQSLIGLTGTAAQASTAVANGLAMGATGSGSIMASIGTAMPYVAIALAAAAALGLFRKTTTTGQGISGTFGGEDSTLQNYTQKRKSGFLFGGPEYWKEYSPLDSKTTLNLQNGFKAVKTSAIDAAQALGLSADSITSYKKDFTLALTGDATKDAAAVEALYAGMSEDMARGLIGSYKNTVTTVREEIAAQYYEGGSIGGGFTERQVTTSTYTPSEFANEGETASQTLFRLASSIKIANGAFDMLGLGLIDVGLQGASTASKLIDAFGGAEAFAGTMGSYYQNFYTDAERTARLSEVTGTALGKLGLTMPAMDAGARAWYRSAVELAQAQDMNVEANRTQLASLMALGPAINQLAPAFDAGAAAAENQASWQQKLDIATGKTTQREIDKTAALLAADDATDLIINALYAYEDAATAAAAVTAAQDDAYGALLDANRAVYNAQQESAQSQIDAAQATTDAANAIRDALAGAGQNIVEFVKSLRASIASPANLAASYKTDLLLAQGGDVEASKRIPTSGKAYLDSQIAGATSMVDVQRATARMASELAALPAVKTYEDKLLEAVNGVASAVGGTTSAVVDLHGNFMAGLTLNARSEIVKILEFIVDDTKMTPETKALALLASGSVSRVVALSATSLLRPQDQELALMTGGTIIKTIGTALGANDPLALSIAFAQSSTVEKVIKASGGLLSPDQATLLNAIGVYNKTVNIDVVVSSASLTAFQQLLMTTFGTVDISAIGNTNGTGGINLAGLVGQGALDRLASISTYIQSLSWGASAGQDNANLWTVYDIAKKFGVTQVDLANAAGIYNPGMTYGNLVAGMDAAGIPRFAAGTNYLPSDMLAQVHEGERIVPKADNLLLMQRLQSPQANNEALVAEVRSLNEKMGRLNDEVRALRASSERGNVHTQIAADRLSGRQGVPFLVQVAT